MIFASDNWAGASRKIVDALAEAARSGHPAYGADDITKAVERRFSELFEREVAVFLVASGTVANALALSAYARPGGVVFCHAHAHIAVDEAGAVPVLRRRHHTDHARRAPRQARTVDARGGARTHEGPRSP